MSWWNKDLAQHDSLPQTVGSGEQPAQFLAGRGWRCSRPGRRLIFVVVLQCAVGMPQPFGVEVRGSGFGQAWDTWPLFDARRSRGGTHAYAEPRGLGIADGGGGIHHGCFHRRLEAARRNLRWRRSGLARRPRRRGSGGRGPLCRLIPLGSSLRCLTKERF